MVPPQGDRNCLLSSGSLPSRYPSRDLFIQLAPWSLLPPSRFVLGLALAVQWLYPAAVGVEEEAVCVPPGLSLLSRCHPARGTRAQHARCPSELSGPSERSARVFPGWGLGALLPGPGRELSPRAFLS